MDVRLKRQIDAILFALVVLDLVLSVWAFFFPELWVRIFHGSLYIDPQGLVRRMGANWAAFLLFQTVAAIKWRAQPQWLLVVAGLRLSDIFTDWTYLAFCQSITPFGRAGLLAMSPLNMLIGWYLFKSYSLCRSKSSR